MILDLEVGILVETEKAGFLGGWQPAPSRYQVCILPCLGPGVPMLKGNA